MSNVRTMDDPVTRRELHEALDLWAGAIISRMDAQFASHTAQMTAQMTALIEASEARQLGELARHVQASEERLRVYIGALDDKYKDLPPRVAALERKVFAPKRRVAKVRRRR